jgi:peptidase M23-like protein/cohesin domain-containing protein
MKFQNLYLLRVISLLALLISFVPVSHVDALPVATTLPPVDMFQLPWDQGLAWVAIDGLDNGTKRPLSSSHNYSVGGAIDFAPHNNMRKGENTSNFWVTAVAGGTVIQKSFCHVKIDHGNGWTSEYQFLANVQVKVGDAIFRNQRLAIIANGTTQPFCPGSQEINVPHVHFMLRPTLRNVTFAGWTVNYLTLLNRTTFTKGGQTVGLFQPLLNTMDGTQIVLRGPITWDTTYTGSIDTFRYERWSLTLTEPHKFTLTATPTTTGLVPLILLLDANGNELTRGTSTLTSSQPAGSYFVQIQPQAGNGFYSLLLQKSDEPLPTGPYVSTVVIPATMNVGDVASATVSLNNVPAEGYSSAEFTCTYDASRISISNISVGSLFGVDPAAAINDPQNGSFIVAIAGSKGTKATTDGIAFTFSVTALNAGQTVVDCKARVSAGDNALTELPFVGANLVILGSTPTPTPTPGGPPPATDTPTPTFTTTPTSATSNWLTFTNLTYGFQFKYPPDSWIETGGTDTDTIIHLPFAPGTNLGTKYLQMIVAENANPCQSPLATESMLETSATVVINGISFLKQTGQDATAGHINKWVAYTTSQGIACVSLDFVLRAANPGAFATPPPLYDEAAEKAVFDQIVATYAWLTSTATPTPSTPGNTATPTSSTPVDTATPTSLTPVDTATPTSSTPVDMATPTSSTPVDTATPTSSTPVDSATPTSSTPAESPTPTAGADGSLTGQVLAGKPITVSLYSGTTLVTSVTANNDGTFSLTAPAGSYTILATSSGFVSAQGSATITGGSTTTKPTITLLAGDIDGNNVIDQFDALTIGMNYNAATPSAADLNNDNVINVLDLELLANNYRATGPLAWE